MFLYFKANFCIVLKRTEFDHFVSGMEFEIGYSNNYTGVLLG